MNNKAPVDIPIGDTTALLLIDRQQGFDDWSYWNGQRNNPQAEKNAQLLLKEWRHRSWPIFPIPHASSLGHTGLAATQTGYALKEGLRPLENEPLMTKAVNSAFMGTDLQQQLLQHQFQQVALTGLTTDHCVSTTARMASNPGFETVVIHDATAAFSKKGFRGKSYTADQIHFTARAHVKDEIAFIVSAQKLLHALQKMASPLSA